MRLVNCSAEGLLVMRGGGEVNVLPALRTSNLQPLSLFTTTQDYKAQAAATKQQQQQQAPPKEEKKEKVQEKVKEEKREEKKKVEEEPKAAAAAPPAPPPPKAAAPPAPVEVGQSMVQQKRDPLALIKVGRWGRSVRVRCLERVTCVGDV